MRKPVFCIFLWPLYSDIIFFIHQYCAGVSNKHYLLPFSIQQVACSVVSLPFENIFSKTAWPNKVIRGINGEQFN